MKVFNRLILITHTIAHKLIPIETDSGNKSVIVSTKITKLNKSAVLKCVLLTCINRLLLKLDYMFTA